MSHKNRIHEHVGGLRPRRTVFNLNYRKNFTCNMGQLIPVVADEVVPGDHIKIGNELVIRFQPLVAPIMHEITATVHYFFVPYRLLWDEWESFISQGQLGGSTPLPIQLPTFDYLNGTNNTDVGSLWDYLGFPVRASNNSGVGSSPELAIKVMDMPFRAYNFIWNEYYRDENLQAELAIDSSYSNILNRNWKKDYFTSALPFRQKGTPPALPVHLVANSPDGFGGFLPSALYNNAQGGSFVSLQSTVNIPADAAGTNVGTQFNSSAPEYGNPALTAPHIIGVPLVDPLNAPGLGLLSRVSASTFDVSDMRLAFQTQKWLERNARGGTRYTEFLRSHFGVSPTDARLDRPEYIGGTRQPVIISEVLQTSQTTKDGDNPSPQGQFAGHGLSATGNFAGSYNVQEYGIIVGLLSVMPKPSYQNGINRQWLRRLPTDFYFPEFAHLSEQGIYTAELYAGFGMWPTDNNLFGYCGQYDEMRIKHDMVCSEMRVLNDGTPDLSYWNLSRAFTSPPNLNSAFITCAPDDRIFAVGGVPELIVNCQNLITAVRPLPAIAEPGLVDHF